MFNFKILEQHGQKREAGEEMACVGNHRCDWKLSMGGIVRAKTFRHLIMKSSAYHPKELEPYLEGTGDH